MFEKSVAGTLWYWWRQSGVFAVLRAVYHWFRNAWQYSLIRRMLVHVSRIQEKYEASLFARIVNAVLGGISAVLGLFFGWFARINAGSVNERVFRRIFSGSFILRFESLFGIFVAAMFLFPHDYWNNSFALAGAVAFLALYLCVCGARGEKPLSPARLGLPMMLFAIVCFGSLAFSYDFHDSVRILLLLIAAFLLCYIAAASVRDRRSLMTVLGFIYFAVLLTACYALVQRVLGVRVSSSFTDLHANRGVPGRVFATMDNPNNYAEFLVMMTPLAAVWAVKVRAKLRTLPLSPFLCCGLALPMLAMVMTYSRSGWISVALAFAILFYYGDKRWIPLLLLACVLAIPFLPNSIVVRLTSMVSGEDSSSRFRVYIWQGIFLLLLDHGLTGIGLGPGSFAVVYKQYARSRATIGVPHSHMLWTEMLVETGVLGLITSLWMFLGIVRRSAVGAARSPKGVRRLALCACLGALIGISVTFFVEYVWFYPRDMFAFFIVCGLAIGLLNAPEEAFPEEHAPLAA